jgi:type I restriction enzyme S subunit
MMSDHREALPAGWTIARLPDLVGEQGVLTDGDWVETQDQDPNGDVRLTQLADVGDGVFRDRSKRFMTRGKAAELRCTFLEPGDVLIARMPDPLGRACIFPGDPRPAVTAVDVCIARPSASHVSSRWLMNTINAPAFRAAVARLQSGSTRKRISKANLCTIQLPVPPTREQHRIAEAVDSLLTRLDAAVSTLERVQRNLKRYRTSVLKAAVEGRLVPTEAELARAEGRDYEPASVLLGRILTERRRRWGMAGTGKYPEPVNLDSSDLPALPEGWCWTTVDSLIWDADYGTSQKCAYNASGPPVLRIPNIQRHTISFEDVKFAAEPASLNPHGIVKPGDLLFIRTNGSPSLIGQGAVVVQELPRAYHFASYLIRLRVVNVDVVPRWIGLVWHSPVVRGQILAATASSAGQHNVSIAVARRIAVPVAPLDEQRRILFEVDRTASLIDMAAATAAAGQGRCARLRQAILKWAFEGKLADQDPSDEPAAVLLERIRTETVAREDRVVPKAGRHRRAKGIQRVARRRREVSVH